MNSFERHSAVSFPTARATVHEARAAVAAVDRALRVDSLAGPADAYHVIGSLGLMVRTLERSLDDLATWWREQEHRRLLTVAEGPFADDPEAAVGVAMEALAHASAACAQAYDALERAHMATAHIGAELGPVRKPRRWLWRRPRP